MTRAILIGCIGLLLAAAAPAEPGQGRGACRTEIVTGADLSVDDAVRDALLYLREEEKLARDVYRTLGDVHDIAAFRNIAGAEQRHMDAVLSLLRRYGIPDVVGENPVGTFSDASLGKLYGTLVARGRKSPVEALAVGATVEEMDIADLRSDLVLIDDAAVRPVLENLLRASRNHLRAFTGLLREEGVTYVPVHLEKEAYDAILAAGHERGRGGSSASGQQGRRGGREGPRGRRGRQGRSGAASGSCGGSGTDGGCEGDCSGDRPGRGRRGAAKGRGTGGGCEGDCSGDRPGRGRRGAAKSCGTGGGCESDCSGDRPGRGRRGKAKSCGTRSGCEGDCSDDRAGRGRRRGAESGCASCGDGKRPDQGRQGGCGGR